MKYVQKCPTNQTMSQRKFEFWKNGINSKLKHRKAHNSILSGGFGYPVREIDGNGRDSRIIRESWHVWTKCMKEISGEIDFGST